MRTVFEKTAQLITAVESATAAEVEKRMKMTAEQMAEIAEIAESATVTAE